MEWSGDGLTVYTNEYDEYVFLVRNERVAVERWLVEELVAEIYASLAGDE